MKFTFGIIQIITNTCKVCFCAQFNKKYILTSTQFQYMTFLPNPRGQVCVLIQSVTLHVGLSTLLPLKFDMQHDHFSKKKMTF